MHGCEASWKRLLAGMMEELSAARFHGTLVIFIANSFEKPIPRRSRVGGNPVYLFTWFPLAGRIRAGKPEPFRRRLVSKPKPLETLREDIVPFTGTMTNQIFIKDPSWQHPCPSRSSATAAR